MRTLSDDTLWDEVSQLMNVADSEYVIAHLLGMAHSLSKGVYEPLVPADEVMLKAAAALLRRRSSIVVTTDFSRRGCPCS